MRSKFSCVCPSHSQCARARASLEGTLLRFNSRIRMLIFDYCYLPWHSDVM